MTIKSSGVIFMSDINAELGLARTTAIDLNQSIVRSLLGVSSGTIHLSAAYGKSVYVPPPGGESGGTPGTDGGTCCFDHDALVLMIDGIYKKISSVCVGDVVMGSDGSKNNVVGTKSTTVGSRQMVKMADHNFYVTDDHLFKTNNGWKTWRPERLIYNNSENSSLLSDRHGIDKNDSFEYYSNGEYAFIDPNVEFHDFDSNVVVYDLHLDGNRTYIVEGFVVHNCGESGGEGGEGGD